MAITASMLRRAKADLARLERQLESLQSGDDRNTARHGAGPETDTTLGLIAETERRIKERRAFAARLEVHTVSKDD